MVGVTELDPRSLSEATDTRITQPCSTQVLMDLIFQLQPNCIFYGPTGSTHGTGYTYDTHVPFLMMGAGVSAGSSYEKMHITDVVDKVAEKVHLPYAPNSLIH